MKATKQLRDEHEGILIMLKIIESIIKNYSKTKKLHLEEFEKIIEFLKGFVDKCHHGKEEDLLFPALEEAGIPKENGPIGMMLTEHQMGRGYIKNMNESLIEFKKGVWNDSNKMIENAKNYIYLLRTHIDKENNILFNMADSALSSQKQDELFDDFEKIEIERIGIGKHEEYHALIEQLEKKYL